jgi:hypothetical protein
MCVSPSMSCESLVSTSSISSWCSLVLLCAPRPEQDFWCAHWDPRQARYGRYSEQDWDDARPALLIAYDLATVYPVHGIIIHPKQSWLLVATTLTSECWVRFSFSVYQRPHANLCPDLKFTHDEEAASTFSHLRHSISHCPSHPSISHSRRTPASFIDFLAPSPRLASLKKFTPKSFFLGYTLVFIPLLPKSAQSILLLPSLRP